ncbi:MAG: hypothetical protein LBG27_10765 [Spirochaetaceae bacterium]|nr:hypothetical protein [Spirochaetaceae bacterium]
MKQVLPVKVKAAKAICLKSPFFWMFFLILSGLPGTGLFCGETERERDLFFLPLASYDYVNTEDQRLHVPGLGFAVMKGEQDVPFNEVRQ